MDEHQAIQGFTQALSERAWYPATAFLFTLLIKVVRLWWPRIFEGTDGQPPIVPKHLQWSVALLVVGASAFTEAFFSGLGVEIAIGLSVFAMLTGGTSAVGIHRIGKEVSGNVGLAIALGFLLVGCGSVKPLVRTVDDIARDLCAVHFGEQLGIPFEEAARTYCEAREDWAPFLDPLLAAKREGGELAAQRHGISRQEK